MSAAVKPNIDLAEQIGEFFDDPLGFVIFAFEWGEGDLKDSTGPDEWQREQLIRVGKHFTEGKKGALREAIASGHGIGKTATVAWIILWAMSTRPHLTGSVTANTMTQLNTKTWRELRVWHKRVINKHWFKWTATRFVQVDHPETWGLAAVPNSEHNSEAFAGTHGKDVLMIFDEASKIPDSIWQTTDGAMTNPGAMWFVYGNPTRNTGRFRECFGKFRHRWHTEHIDSRDTKVAENKDEIQSWIDDYGEDSDFVRVRVRGLFPRVGDSQFIPEDLVEAAMCRELSLRDYGHYQKVIGVDVARFGDDESVIVRRQGPKVWEPKTYRGVDTMELVGYVVDEFRSFEAEIIFVDGIGVGAGVVDRLRELGFPVVDVVVSNSATDARQYYNLRAEIWGKLREFIKTADIPRRDKLRDDLVGPEYGFSGKMQLQIESKDDMKARGLASPDEAESIAVTLADFKTVGRNVKARPVIPAPAKGWT